MAREVNKLSPAAIKNAKRPGMYGDGAGLWLHVGPERRDEHGKKIVGGKSWILRFMLNGNAREMGLGPLHTVGLAEARERARAARLMLLDGVDPLDTRREDKHRRKLEVAKRISFKECAEAYVAAHRAAWKNAKHAAQWDSTLEAYAHPLIGDLPVQGIDTALVMKIIEPIWATKTETASRLRGRIEAILDWATVREYRSGDNPARWRGHLDALLPARSKVQRGDHHAALPYAEIGAFMTALREEKGTGARAFEFAILTAARTGEVIGATWHEVNMAEKVWIIPGNRMKAGKEHRVPLAPRAIEILKEMAKFSASADDFVFPGRKAGAPLSNMTFLMILRRMGRGDLTGHGFRSTFRDWCAEQTAFPAEVAEMALAHAVGDKVEAAYRRGDLFEKRRRLSDAWAAFCARPPKSGTVTSIHSWRQA